LPPYTEKVVRVEALATYEGAPWKAKLGVPVFIGVVVPMATLPINMEVAVVEVAVIYATVGLVEALIVVPLDESHPCPNEV
jgi:hypothetical protein